MKEHPREDAEVVSQALYGEKLQVGNEMGDWVAVITPDRYPGWVKKKHLFYSTQHYPEKEKVRISNLSAFVFATPTVRKEPHLHLPYGTCLELYSEEDAKWISVRLPDGTIGHIPKGHVAREHTLKSPADLVDFAYRFQGIPYSWGGRSSFGFDCSGFVQMLYAHLGVILPRDSWQQAADPRFKTVDFELIQPGDLVFFGASPAKISHVGLVVNQHEFIHTTARENKEWLRVSRFDEPEWNGGSDLQYRSFRRLI